MVALLAAFPSSPASNLGHLTSATQPPPTSTTTSAPTTTTTTLAAIPAALAVLNRDIASDQSNGTLDPAAAQSITSQAQQAVLDAAAGQPDQAASHLQRAAIAIDTGQLDGSVDPAAAPTLQSDLSALATALGVGSAATGTTGTTDATDTTERDRERDREGAVDMVTGRDKVRATEEQSHPSDGRPPGAHGDRRPDRALLPQPVRRCNSATRSAMGTRTCSVLSRSRTVTASSSRESKSTVTHQGVPTSS